jgi:hypothetical protein
MKWGLAITAVRHPVEAVERRALLAPLDMVRSGVSRPRQHDFDTQSPRGSVLRADRASVRFDAAARYGKSEAIPI